MRNLKLLLEYDGTNYVGWQVQLNGVSIQEVLEKRLEEILKEPVKVQGAGRTDSGVHALGMVANVHTSRAIPTDALRRALNSRLPEDIAVRGVEEAGEAFDARHSCTGKHYRYTVFCGDRPPVFIRLRVFPCKYSLDVERMRVGARHLLGEHDFTAFRAANCAAASPVRNLRSLDVTQDGPLVHFDFKATGYLYKMVRNITGTLIDVGRGFLAPEDVKDILETKDRSRCGTTVPARGLVLVETFYDQGDVRAVRYSG